MKKKSLERNIPKKVFEANSKVRDVNIGEYNRHGMLLFGANVQLARAIPDIIDGFKPIGRRVLYAVAKIAGGDKKMKKVLALIGNVIQIHPHGDSSVEDTITSFSKDWELTYPLITIKGNNGTPKGGEAAAARYLQGMISDYAYDCYFKEWDKDLVEMSQSYNPEELEPDYLISRFPDLLLRPSVGFTFGVATNIPSYNLEEAFNAVINLIKDPNYDPILIPDMPSDCIILDEGNFPEICHTGTGAFNMRSEIFIDEKSHSLIINSVPYKVDLDDVKDKINALRATDLSGLKNMFDASTKVEVKLILTFQPGTDLVTMRNTLYKKTQLQKAFATKMTYVDNYEIVTLNLKQVMQSWIDNRRIIKRKFLIGKLVNSKERVHILKVLIDICSDEELCKKIIHMIRDSERDEIIDNLHGMYDISTLQARNIAKMRVEGFSQTSLKEYIEEKKKLEEDIEEYEELIKKPKKIDRQIIKELEEAIGKFNKPRRCRVIKYNQNDDELVISNKDYILVFTRNGFVKKLAADSSNIGKLNENDDPVETVKINNRDSVVLFDDKGMIHCIAVNNIPESDKNSKGITLSQFARIKGKIISVFAKSALSDKGGFIFVTKKGMVKKTEISAFSLKTSVLSIVLKKTDELVSVMYADNDKDVIIFSQEGYGTRFNTSEVTPTTRMSTGVIGMTLLEDDIVLGACVVNKNDTHFAIITEKGMGKLCGLDDLDTTKRRGAVVRLIQLIKTDRTIEVIPCTLNSSFLAVLKNETVDVQAEDIPILTRNHYGKKIVPVRKGDLIIKFMKLV